MIDMEAELRLGFYDEKSECLVPDIWGKLRGGLWKRFRPDDFISNFLLPPSALHRQCSVFPGYMHIPSGTIFDLSTKKLKLDLYRPKLCENADIDVLLGVAESYFSDLGAKRIGVHLSGGFDSGLIMSILHCLKIPFVPIGLRAATYEFRTERIVQDYYMGQGQDGLLIDLEDYPFYGELLDIPASQLPPENIKTIASARALSKAFAERGCDVVLSGQGGDSIFVDDCRDFTNLKFNIGDEFVNDAQSERIYASDGIRLMSFYAHTPVIDLVCSMRRNQKEDPLKCWARNCFKGILPRELSEYTYVADFFGLSKWGLNQAKDTVKFLFERAHEISGHDMFSNVNISRMIDADVFDFEYPEYVRYCALISVASWYNTISKIAD